ncbi:MAG: AAA family ATPase [Muribaculaceae bacterium]|nr:AAA family ATPase [Muribaculaceae bacterium]
MDANYIQNFIVVELWNRFSIEWKNVYRDVNILVGINGSGKTTLLNLMYEYYTLQKIKKSIATGVSGTEINVPITYIHSFDVPASGKKKTESQLLQQLKGIINQNDKGTSFFDYRMRIVNYPEQKELVQRRLAYFFEVVDKMFQDTGKHICYDREKNTLAFQINDIRMRYERPKLISLDELSSGEKQLLLILTTVFLQEEKPNVLLMDEPEVSLHISWQDQLISRIRELNPNCQLILTTHSPNIFADGWEDKLVFMDDITYKFHDES